jgi:hypothetical protein
VKHHLDADRKGERGAPLCPFRASRQREPSKLVRRLGPAVDLVPLIILAVDKPVSG